MRKTVYFIGGTMGVGKTTVSRKLKCRLDNSVFLDGDWCWDAHPFQVTPETKKMVLENICFLLNQFLRCDAYENVIFCWVLHEQEILDCIFSGVDMAGCRVICISLVCRREALVSRIQKDIEAGIREPNALLRSVERLPYYEKLDTLKLDVSDMTADAAADYISRL